MALEPQSANDYSPRTTEAVKSVLLEIGQTLGAFAGKFVVIGGSVPWLQLNPDDMKHVGTIDVDLSLDAEALGGGEYKTLVEALHGQDYHKTADAKKFQLVRTIQLDDGGPAIDVIIDFLTPRAVVLAKNDPPLVDDFAVQKADGAALAHAFFDLIKIEGKMPEGGNNAVHIAVASIPALLVMKGFALSKRSKNKDAYDIYYVVRNYPGGVKALTAACRPLLDFEEAAKGYRLIDDKFATPDFFGPTCVQQFVTESEILDGRTPDQWRQDAFGQVDAWLREMKIRK